MLKGHDADAGPLFNALREGRDELRNILGGQSQALDARLTNVDTKLTNTRGNRPKSYGASPSG
jgi:hypothetical protein